MSVAVQDCVIPYRICSSSSNRYNLHEALEVPLAAKNPKSADPGFGEYVAQLRLGRGLTQAQLARGANITISTMSKQERSTECHLRPTKLIPLVNCLHAAMPLSEEQLAFLRKHGNIPADFEPGPPRQMEKGERTMAEAHDIEVAYQGRMWEACDIAHKQILDAAPPTTYFRALTRLALTMGVELHFPGRDQR